MKVSVKKEYVSPLLLFLVVLFVSCLIMANVLANQMLQFWVFAIDAGTLVFPITYVLSDVFSEVYGYRWSRRVTWVAAGMNLILALLIKLAIVLPQPEWYDGSHFSAAVGGSFRIVIASIVSYVAGDFINDRIFRIMKRKPSLKGFSVRAVVSSFGGSIVDTSLFVVIAFAGAMPVREMFPMIIITVAFKTVYEIIILPATYKVAKVVGDQEKKYAETRKIECV